MSEAKKYDDGKTRLDLIDPVAIEQLGQVLTHGAKKYGAQNWREGMAWGRLLGAALRHIWAWARGEKTDPETGLSHLSHAMCCLMFLVNYEATGIGTDDRATVALTPGTPNVKVGDYITHAVSAVSPTAYARVTRLGDLFGREGVYAVWTGNDYRDGSELFTAFDNVRVLTPAEVAERQRAAGFIEDPTAPGRVKTTTPAQPHNPLQDLMAALMGEPIRVPDHLRLWETSGITSYAGYTVGDTIRHSKPGYPDGTALVIGFSEDIERKDGSVVIWATWQGPNGESPRVEASFSHFDEIELVTSDDDDEQDDDSYDDHDDEQEDEDGRLDAEAVNLIPLVIPKPGTVVRVVNGWRAGDVGRVAEYDEENNEVKLEYSTGYPRYFNPKDLQEVDPTTKLSPGAIC